MISWRRALRTFLEATHETIQDLVLAAEDRYWDAYELAVQGRAFAAIYVGGYSAELLLKIVGFRFDGALPGDLVQPRLGPAKALGAAYFPSVKHESYHSLRFWTAFLEHKRAVASRPLTSSMLAELHHRMDRLSATWWVSMRYRAAAVPTAVANMAEAELHAVLDDVDWLMKNNRMLWS